MQNSLGRYPDKTKKKTIMSLPQLDLYSIYLAFLFSGQFALMELAGFLKNINNIY